MTSLNVHHGTGPSSLTLIVQCELVTTIKTTLNGKSGAVAPTVAGAGPQGCYDNVSDSTIIDLAKLQLLAWYVVQNISWFNINVTYA